MASKLAGLSEVVRSIPDGAEIALGSFAITRNPIAFSNELIRQGKKKLTIYEIIGAMDGDMLVGAGCVKRYVYGGGSLDRFGRIGRINEAIEQNKLEVLEYSGLSISLRFLAGSLGIPYIPAKTPLGTDVLATLLKKDRSIKIGSSPFSGERVVMLQALQPEYAVIHAPMADERGNVIIEGPAWDDELAKSAKKLLVTVDRLVSNEYVRQNPEKVVIPSVYTHIVMEVPYGAYPTSVYRAYDYDGEFLSRYAKINQNQETFDAFIKEYVTETKDHFAFLEKAGGLVRMTKIQADPVFGYHKR